MSIKDVRYQQRNVLVGAEQTLTTLVTKLRDVALDSTADSIDDWGVGAVRRTRSVVEQAIAAIEEREEEERIAEGERRTGPHDDHDELIPGCVRCDRIGAGE